MAILLSNDKKDQNQENGQQNGQQPVQLSSDAGMISGGTGPNQGKGTSSGRFVNIQNVINANKQSGQNLASNVGGQIRTVGQGARQDIGNANQTFRQSAEQGRLNKDVVVPEAQNIIQNAGTATTPEQTQRFQRISSGEYKGPARLDNYDELYNKASKAQTLGKQVTSPQGQTGVLSQLLGVNNYTGGQQKLDQLFLGANPNQMRGARNATQNLTNIAGKTYQDTENLGNQYRNEAAEVGAQVKDKLNQEQAAYDESLRQKFLKAQEDQQKFNEEFEQTKTQLSQGQLQKDALERLGLQQLQNLDSIYNVNLGDYLNTTINETPKSIAEVLNESEAARVNALLGLANQEARYKPEEINKFKASEQSYNIEKLLADINQRAAQYDQEKRAEQAYNTVADRALANWMTNNIHQQTFSLGGDYKKQVYDHLMSQRPNVSEEDYQRALAIAGGTQTDNEQANRATAQVAAARAAALQKGRKINLID